MLYRASKCQGLAWRHEEAGLAGSNDLGEALDVGRDDRPPGSKALDSN